MHVKASHNEMLTSESIQVDALLSDRWSEGAYISLGIIDDLIHIFLCYLVHVARLLPTLCR